MKGRVELTPWLDASELAWGGVLEHASDGTCWAWVRVAERSDWLFGSGHVGESLRVLASHPFELIDDRQLRLDVEFEVVEAWHAKRARARWSQSFYLQRTTPPLGGDRWWFTCGAAGCGRRRAKLYRPGSRWWACRSCYDLTYSSRARYSARTPFAGGLAAVSQLLDREDALRDRQERSNLRRRLSRYRRRVRSGA